MNRTQRRRAIRKLGLERGPKTDWVHTVRMHCGHVRRVRGIKPRDHLRCVICHRTRNVVRITTMAVKR